MQTHFTCMYMQYGTRHNTCVCVHEGSKVKNNEKVLLLLCRNSNLSGGSADAWFLINPILLLPRLSGVGGTSKGHVGGISFAYLTDVHVQIPTQDPATSSFSSIPVPVPVPAPAPVCVM